MLNKQFSLEKPPTEEERAYMENQRNLELQDQVKVLQEQKQRDRERRQKNEALIAQVNRDEQARQAQAKADAELYGFTDEQKKLYKRAKEIQHSLDYSNLSDAQRLDLETEQSVYIKKICQLGRNQGSIWFRAVTVYINGNQMIVPDPQTGKLGYREGNFILGAQATDKLLETDEKGIPKFITLPNVIEKTNIPITNKWEVKIIGKDTPTQAELNQRPKPKVNQIFPPNYRDPNTPATLKDIPQQTKEASKVSKFLGRR
jgi:hypothetical protein